MVERGRRGRIIRTAAVIAMVGAVLIQLVRPARTNPTTDPTRTMLAIVHPPAPVQAVLERGCRDCHSNDTRWPWYSNVAPMSWFVIDHVNHGRRHFNYSDWSSYNDDDQDKLLGSICSLTRRGRMPLPSYLLIHRDARLST